MEKHVFELCCGLLRRGIDVEIVCEDRSFLPDPVNELRRHIIPLPAGAVDSDDWVELYREKALRFAEMLDPTRYDVVHCHSQYGYEIARRLWQLDERPALVTTFHLTPIGTLDRYRRLGIPEPEGAPIDREVAQMEAVAARHSDRCIAVSRGVADEIVQFYGVSPDRVEVVYNWYDPANFEFHSHEDARWQLGLDPNRFYLIYIGHFELHRGQLLAEAMRRLPMDVTLLCVHPEPDEEIDIEFGERVQFAGYLPPERLALYYAASDLQCFPTIYGGFGLVLVEGMACGCPPVVFNYPAMNEIVTPRSGYLVDRPTPESYADAVWRALQDGGAKRAAAVARAKDFRMDPQIDRVVGVYRQILAKRGAHTSDPMDLAHAERGTP